MPDRRGPINTANKNGIVAVGLTWDFDTEVSTVPGLMRLEDLRSTRRLFINLMWAEYWPLLPSTSHIGSSFSEDGRY